MKKQSPQEVSARITSHTLPRYKDLPSFDIYADQLIPLVNETVGLYYLPEEKLLTASMVNNYVKQGVVPKPGKKKYSRNHIAYLIVICILKKVFSIHEIFQLIQLQKSALDSDKAYDAFIDTLEGSINEVFLGHAAPEVENPFSAQDALILDRAVAAFSNKVYTQTMLQAIS